MATTKIWSVKSNMDHAISYIMNKEKTMNGKLVTGLNCIPRMAYDQMKMTKQRFGKTGGNLVFHAYQSFPAGEVTPQQAHEIGVELARKLWGSKYEVVVATHVNTDCYHNHFVFNSVSFRDGRHYNDTRSSYMELREASDLICRERGLSTIEKPGSTHTPRQLYLAEKNDEPTRYNIMRQDIDMAIACSYDGREFLHNLRTLGYIVRDDPGRKYATIQMPGTSHPTRFKTLGEDYTEEAIQRRILQQDRYYYMGRPPRFTLYKGSKGSLRNLYLYYCYLLGYVKANPHPSYSASLKASLRQLDAYSAQAQLLSRHEIDTVDHLSEYIDSARGQLGALLKERSRIYKSISRCSDPAEASELVGKRDSLTSDIKLLRQDLKTAKAVLERSDSVREAVMEVVKEQENVRER